MKQSKWFLPVFFSLVGIVAFFSIKHFSDQNEEAKFKKQQTQYSIKVNHLFHEHFQEIILVQQRMANRWARKKRDYTKNEWMLEAMDSVNDYQSYQAIGYNEKDSTVRWIYPEINNKVAIGYQLSTNPIRNEAILLALKTHKTAITRTIDLKQGGKGILIITPVFRESYHLGFVVGVFKIQNLINLIQDNRFVIELYESNDLVFKGSKKRSNYHQSLAFEVVNTKWKVGIFTAQSQLTPRPTQLVIYFIFAFIVSILLTALVHYFLQHQNNVTEIKSIFDSFPDLIFKINEDGLIINDHSHEGLVTSSNSELLVGQKIQSIFPNEIRSQFDQALQNTKNNSFQVFSYQLNANGQNKYFEARIIKYHKQSIMLIIRDTTEINKLEIERKKSEKEKDILLQEVHHRVKNNLQTIISIIDLQAANQKDQSIINDYKNLKSRVFAIALIHKLLYQSHDISKIKLCDLIKPIINHPSSLYQIAENVIEVQCIGDEYAIEIEEAINCGIIVNEVLTNSLKHAFDSFDEAKIKITIYSNKKQFITISDNGCGFAKDNGDDPGAQLGLTIIEGLSKQMKANYSFSGDQGTTFKMEFYP